ncbi:MAG: hypothetical protein HOY79_14630 [Streptomyces sp.]|nr:hypothetical protein [Streptomyces sp.]
MSFGDPNNPYGPPNGQQPGYGYPQQQPQALGYGYPSAPPVGPYGGAPVMTTMPGTVSAGRVLLWFIVPLQLMGVALFAYILGAVQKTQSSGVENDASFEKIKEYSSGVLWAMVVFALAWAVFAAVLALKFSDGGNRVRVTAIVFGVITAILGIYPFVVVGLLHTVLGILIAVFAGNANGSAWFNRVRQ